MRSPTVALSLACALALVAHEVSAGSLPTGVIAAAEEALPGYILPGTEGDGSQLGFGDFDADGRDDVAALLQGEADWQLVVFRQVENQHYRTELIGGFPGDDRAFKQRFSADDLELEAVARGGRLELAGAVIEDAAPDAASLVLHLPAAELQALLFRWNAEHQLFGTSRLHLAAAPSTTRCAYDPQSGSPNPLGTRAFVTIEEQDGDTSVVYQQFPENLLGPAPVTLATKRELVFHQTPIEQARAFMREEPGYYLELTGDDDPAGFAPVDASLTCR